MNIADVKRRHGETWKSLQRMHGKDGAQRECDSALRDKGWLIAEHDRLTAANLDLTERVLYAERERDEAKGQEAAVEKERRHWYDLCGKANVRVSELTAELARKDAALEHIASSTMSMFLNKDHMLTNMIATAQKALS